MARFSVEKLTLMNSKQEFTVVSVSKFILIMRKMTNVIFQVPEIVDMIYNFI